MNVHNLVNKFFYGLTGLILCLLLLQIIMIPFRFNYDFQKSDRSSGDHFKLMKLKPIETYRQAFATHALFSKVKEKVIQKGPGIDDLLKAYSIVGLVQGASPQVLIQNNMTKQTNFVTAGEMIDKIKLVQIKPHSIIVEYSGEQKEVSITEGMS